MRYSAQHRPALAYSRYWNTWAIRSDWTGANRQILATAATGKFKLLWVDGGTTIRPATLKEAKRLCPGLIRVHYNSDDAFGEMKAHWRNFSVPFPIMRCILSPMKETCSNTAKQGHLKLSGCGEAIALTPTTRWS